MSLLPPDPNADAARYTTVELVKERLAIPATDTTRDDEILQSIIGAEFAIDTFCGRGFPDVQDAVEPFNITIVPKSVEVAALSLSIAFWKEADAPTGSAGSDAFFGSVSTAETTRLMLQRTPGLVGFRVGAGFGVA